MRPYALLLGVFWYICVSGNLNFRFPEMYHNFFRKPEMQIVDLISQAKATSGLTFSQMAEELDVGSSTFTAWRKGEYRPGPTDIVYLAEKAGLEPFQVLAELESAMHPTMASVWQRAVSSLRQNKG